MININNFQPGVLKQQYQYKDFLTVSINDDWTWEEPTINLLLEEASYALGGLDALAGIIPDMDLYIFMHKIKEANTSSKIEGTQTQIEIEIENLGILYEVSGNRRNKLFSFTQYLKFFRETEGRL